MSTKPNPLAKANAVKAERKRRASKMTEALVAAQGETPKDVMLRVMWGLVSDAAEARTAATKRRLMRAAADVAKDVAPYVHPKLANVSHTGEGGQGPVQHAMTVTVELVHASPAT